jgi:putative transposase
MHLSYKYRAYANQRTLDNASQWLECCRNIYNLALENRISCWQDDKDTPSFRDQCKGLTKYRTSNPMYGMINCHCLRFSLIRLDFAFKAFFRRMRLGECPGFPRFKGLGRYDSFTLDESGWKIISNRLHIANVGMFKLHISRPIHGSIKTVTMKRMPSGKWYAIFSYDNVPERKLEPCARSVGLDVGIKNYCVDSDGLATPNPNHLRQSLKLLRMRQRRLSRRIKGSNGRKQARILVAKAHEYIEAQRGDFLHKLANYYVYNYGTIAIEDLNIKGMVRNHNLALSISDSSWGRFFELLSYKAEYAGRTLIKVPPQNTSQLCSSCGEKVEKTLAERMHKCPYCGLVLDRDENAARNIKQHGVGLTPHTSTWANTPCVV